MAGKLSKFGNVSTRIIPSDHKHGATSQDKGHISVNDFIVLIDTTFFYLILLPVVALVIMTSFPIRFCTFLP